MIESAGKIAIEVEGLKKSFDQVKALRGLNFNVYDGEIFGLLGPNGAGKTTTINILNGLAVADEGMIKLNGIDYRKKPRAAQNVIGVVPDESNLYPELTGFENLCFSASLFGISKPERYRRANVLLEHFGLSEAKDRKFGSYSKGMKRKLTITAGIIHKPKILFLDEPTTGIDVASARQVRQLISNLNKEGTTILLTTHYIEEAERLCDRIAFIVAGKIVRTDSTENLLKPIKNEHRLEVSFVAEFDCPMEKFSAAFPDISIHHYQNSKIILTSQKEMKISLLVGFFSKNGMELREIKQVKPNLEDVFVEITGLEANTMAKEKAGGSK